MTSKSTLKKINKNSGLFGVAKRDASQGLLFSQGVLPMQKKIGIILGHPAHDRRSFCESLALAYQQSAEAAGYRVELVKISSLDFDPILHEGYTADQPLESDIVATQGKIQRADHLVIVYPMWQFALPALMKGFMERTFTHGFAYDRTANNPLKAGLLKGKSARIVQTMGMPALAYRLFYGARAAKALKNALAICGISPINITYFGSVEAVGDAGRNSYLTQMQALGKQGM